MIKKLVPTVLFATAAFFSAASLFAQQPPPARLSPHETISVRIPLENRARSLITLTYGRPLSRKGGEGEVRKIWGGLVPWGKADRLGADEATLLLLQHPIVIGETTIPAGAYTLYIVPSETGASKLAFSSNIGKWGIPVDETHDVARVDLKKDTMDQQIDQLTLALESTGPKAGVLKIKWEKTQFSVPFSVKA